MEQKIIRPVWNKKSSDLRSEWDLITNERYRQIKEDIDISFQYVIKPIFIRLLKGKKFKKTIDIGCGCGNLINILRVVSEKVVGIDYSKISISYCNNDYKNDFDTVFYNISIENFSKKQIESNFDLALANMSIMTMPNINKVAKSINNILNHNSIFIASIPHPLFWPKYWKYDDCDWFKYNEEIPIEAPFKITKQTLNLITTHFHRPIEKYISAFKKNGFILDDLLEPFPNKKVMSLYETPWRYPRFLFFIWKKI